MTKTQTYTEQREFLKDFAKDIRTYLKMTGGVFGVKVQKNNVIFISGAYGFEVPYEERPLKEKEFSNWLKNLCTINGLEISDNMIKMIKFPEGVRATK
jgi:hypothetical protein